MENKITREKLEKYFGLTKKALEEARKNIEKKRKKDADEIISMVSNYLSDAKYFQGKGDFVNAFACLNYAHGWLDSGVRLGVFDVSDDKLFTVR